MGPADLTVGGGGSTLSLVHTPVGTLAYNVTVMNKSLLLIGMAALIVRSTKNKKADRGPALGIATGVSTGLAVGVNSVSTTSDYTPKTAPAATSLTAVPRAPKDKNTDAEALAGTIKNK